MWVRHHSHRQNVQARSGNILGPRDLSNSRWTNPLAKWWLWCFGTTWLYVWWISRKGAQQLMQWHIVQPQNCYEQPLNDCPGLLTAGVLLMHGNARPYVVTTTYSSCSAPSPPNSPCLALTAWKQLLWGGWNWRVQNSARQVLTN